MSVADGGGNYADARFTHGLMEAEIGHHRTDHRIARELALFLQRQGAERQDTVAGDGGAAGIREDHPVSIAIERDTNIGTLLFHDLAGKLGIKGAHAGVDVDAVGVDAELHDLSAKLLEDERSEQIAGAMSAIDDDLHTVEVRIA